MKQRYAIVTEAHALCLDRILSALECRFSPEDAEIWLGAGEDMVLHPGSTRGWNIVRLDECETISLSVPGSPYSIELTRQVLNPLQLIFLGRNQVSQDGYLLGSVYSLLNLIPNKYRAKYMPILPHVLRELYRRFGGCPAIASSKNSSKELYMGNSWAMDEFILKGLPKGCGCLHRELRRQLVPPPPFVLPVGESLEVEASEERLFTWEERSSVFLKELIKPATIAIRAGRIFYEMLAFRVKRRKAKG